MMIQWTGLLAQDSGGGFETILWVIAVLILSGVGALSEKFKQKREESKRHWKPTEIEPPSHPTRRAPPRPSRPAAHRESPAPSAPTSRPVSRRTAVPGAPAQVRPQPQKQKERHVQPTIRRQQEPQRQAPVRRRVRSVTRTSSSTPELIAQLEQRAQLALKQAKPAGPSLAKPFHQADTKASSSQQTPLSRPGVLASVRCMNRMSVSELRRAIVLSEVLRPPLALRDIE